MQFRRGDTFKFKFQRLDASHQILTQTNSPAQIYFTVKHNTRQASVCLQKTLIEDFEDANNTITFNSTDNCYHIIINPSDTDTLPFGTYKYDIEVITSSYKQTIAVGVLTLLEEVTFVSNEATIEESE